MSPVADAFTVGIVLLLLIGAVAFYLYTRLTHVEKRISLLENILLDMRVAMENSFVDFPSPILKAAGGGAVKAQTVEEEEAELLSEYVPKLPTTSSASEAVDADEQIDTSDYEKILESAHIESVEVEEVAEVGEAADTTDASDALEDTTHTIAVSSNAQAAPVKAEVHVNKLEPNYTSMAVKELRTLAQNRGISGVSKMSRKEIIEALSAKDSGVVDGIEATDAGSFESSLTAGAASIDA